MKNIPEGRRPLVAVTPSVDAHADGPRFRLNAAYISALEGAGLTPFIVQPMENPELAAEILDLGSGLVLTGGDDISPSFYGQVRHDATEEASQLRDAWELALTASARERGMPTLAICRGMQLVNVALGGTLIQDIAAQRPDSLVHERSAARGARVHEVELEHRSKLASVVGGGRIRVNSMHHQGIDVISPRLRVSAVATDGIIEAFEWPGDDWWMVAVQWHPEELVDDREDWDRRIFAAFAAQLSANSPPAI